MTKGTYEWKPNKNEMVFMYLFVQTSIFYSRFQNNRCFSNLMSNMDKLNEINHLHRIFVGWVLFAARCIFTTKYGLCDVWLRWSILAWCRDWHLPDTDCVVTVTGEQGLAIGRPGEWQTLWWIGLRCLRNNFWTKLFDGFLACQIL